MLGLLHRTFSSHELESFPAEKDEVSSDKLERVEEYTGEIIESEVLITLLCCTGAKEGGDITCHFSDKERFEEFIGLLNSMGLNCFVDFNPDMTEEENLRDQFGDQVSDQLNSRLEDSEIRTHIFMTKKEGYSLDFVRKLLFYRNLSVRYHRLYGEFLGFPEQNIRCFTYHQRSKYLRKFFSLIGRGEPDLISDWEMAERHEEELSNEEFENLRAFVYCMYPDQEGSLEKALERSEEKRRMLEAYGINVQKYVNLFTDWDT
ncbi:MAG: hypothetical protein ABEK10_02540 [Candidatus Nanosalina sp.]